MNAATKQATWLFLGLITLACLGWHFVRMSTPTARLDAHTLATTPDSMVTGLKVKQFDAKGSLVNFLESPQMQHVPDKNTNVFTTPHIVVTENPGEAWDIRAKQAISLNKGDEIKFVNDVLIQQKNSSQQAQNTFTTDELFYYPKQKFASTNHKVTFKQAGTIVHSVGMQAYLDEKHVKLLNRTHAIYHPHG